MFYQFDAENRALNKTINLRCSLPYFVDKYKDNIKNFVNNNIAKTVKVENVFKEYRLGAIGGATDGDTKLPLFACKIRTYTRCGWRARRSFW